MDLERAKVQVKARSHGMCEGCGKFGKILQVHHRQARQMGGVSGEAADVANDVRNLLALCQACHDETEHAETWDLAEQLGWRIPKWVPDPHPVPLVDQAAQVRQRRVAEQRQRGLGDRVEDLLGHVHEVVLGLVPQPVQHPQRVEDEVADVLAYLLQFCEVLDVDPLRALAAKIDRNEMRFPAP